MVQIYNDVSSVEELIKKHDRIVLYGGGSSCKLLLQAYWKTTLKDHIVTIVDGDDRLSGEVISIEGCSIPIVSINEFIERRRNFETAEVLLLTQVFSSQLVTFLDGIKEFDGTKIYLLPMILHQKPSGGFELRGADYEMIPRTIHFFWIGNKPIPDEYKRNIEGWKKKCPDYDILCWNEDNYDFSTIQYMKEAFLQGGDSLMYATDYARMDVLYQYGGIYLDTDVELIKPLDELLYNEAFIGIEENGQLNSGSAIGAKPRHQMIKKLMDAYKGEHFVDCSGNKKRTFNTYFETKCFIENGYKMVNEYQCVKGMGCYPREVFMPICFAGMEDCFSENTVSIHKINPEHHQLNRNAYLTWKNRIIA